MNTLPDSNSPPSPRPRRRRPALTVRAAIERDGRILFLRARDSSALSEDGYWYFLPGGHVDHGETLEAALRREIREEVGMEVEAIEPAFLREFIAEKHRNLSPEMPPDHHVIALIYRCQAVPEQEPSPTGPIDGTEVVEGWTWLDRDQLSHLDIRPPHLAAALAQATSPAQSMTLWPEE